MKTLFLSPSYACNEKCIFCPCHNEVRKHASLSAEYIIKTLDLAIEKENIEMVLISGGEPTLYKDLLRIISAIRQRDLRLGILSNSLRFADKKFAKDFLVAVGSDFELTTAFHSHLFQIHDSVTSVIGSFEKSLTGIRNMIDAGVSITVKHVINKQSYQFLPDYAEWIYSTFPDNVSWVLCNIDLCGEALEHQELSAVPFGESRTYLEKALDIVIQHHQEGRHRNVSIFNTPYCCIDPYYWNFLRKYDSEEEMSALLLPPENSNTPSIRFHLKGDGGANFAPCEICAVRKTCPGTWKKTADIFGYQIFKPING